MQSVKYKQTNIKKSNQFLDKFTTVVCIEQITYQIYSLGFLFRCLITPGLTPKPLLRKWFYWHLVDHVVGQILREENTSSIRSQNDEPFYVKPFLWRKEHPTWSRLDRLLGSWLRPWYWPLSLSPAAIFLNFFKSTTYRALGNTQNQITSHSSI